MTTSVFGSADLCDAMQTNILPRTFNVGLPHVVGTSTSGSVRPMDSTVLKLLLRGMPLPSAGQKRGLLAQLFGRARPIAKLLQQDEKVGSQVDGISNRPDGHTSRLMRDITML